MRPRSRLVWCLALSAALLFAGADPALAKKNSKGPAKQQSSVKTALAPLAEGVSGSVHLKMIENRGAHVAWMQLFARGLVPSEVYTLEVDGLNHILIAANSQGRIHKKYDLRKGRLGFGFDPRGHVLSLRGADGVVVLAGMVSGEGESDAAQVKERTQLMVTAEAGTTSWARAGFSHNPGAAGTFWVQIAHVPVGDYTVLVEGVPIGTIPVVADGDSHGAGATGVGIVRFREGLGDDVYLPLAVDPRGKEIEILDPSAVLFFYGTMSAQIPNVNDCLPAEAEMDLLGTPPTTGSAEFEVEDDCHAELGVEVENMVPAVYEVRADGRWVADLLVDETGVGSVQLTNRPPEDSMYDDGGVDDGQWSLFADPRGAHIQVVGEGEVVVLDGTFPN